MKTLADLKESYGFVSSEKILGITEQPEQQCPRVDEAIRDYDRMYKEIKSICKDLARIDGAEEMASDIEWWNGNVDFVGALEDLRTQCMNIRDWGQQWKYLAKRLIDKVGVESVLEDEFINI